MPIKFLTSKESVEHSDTHRSTIWKCCHSNNIELSHVPPYIHSQQIVHVCVVGRADDRVCVERGNSKLQCSSYVQLCQLFKHSMTLVINLMYMQSLYPPLYTCIRILPNLPLNLLLIK